MRRHPLALLVAGVAALVLAGCVATGPRPDEAIAPALLASDLDILDVSADTAVDGFSVDVVVVFTVERDEISPDDLREILRVIVANTHLTDVNALRLSGHRDEIDPASSTGGTMRLDLVPAAEQLGFDDPDDGLGTIRVDWDDVVAVAGEAG